MSNLIIQFYFESKSVRVVEIDGVAWFIAKDVAESLGYNQTANGLKHCKRASVLDELNKINDLSPATKWIPEPDMYRMVMNSTLPNAERFQDWVVEEVLPAIRKTGRYSIKPTPAPLPVNPTPLEVEIAVFHAAAQTLRVSDTSKIRMLTVICSQNGGNPQFLPQYVDETLTRAITALLKEHDHPLASKVAKVVNPALQSMGYLERLSRKSTKTGIKEFWSLTETGLEYGRNETSPNNPRETQPMYFVNRFDDLLVQIEDHLYQRALDTDPDDEV